MAKLNTHFQGLKREYIFPVIEKKLSDLKNQHPGAAVVNLGIGDIAQPLAPSIAGAICQAVNEMTTAEGIRGYGPTEGYLFLREAIAKAQYGKVGIEADEIFITEGTNPDTANIQELFHSSTTLGVADPTYPVYLDANIIAGRSRNIILLPCLEDNGFSPLPPHGKKLDFVYLCTPNNPTGTAMTRGQLKEWVDYARKENAVLLIDNAYEAFASSPDVPKTIYEIEGAREVAIELRSFSKTAGFTGLRCAYTVFPKSVHGGELYPLWVKRQAIKTNGVSYPIQRGAAAVFSPEGMKETKAQVASYMAQAKKLSDGLKKLGHACFGGRDAPYIWWKVPAGYTSWQFFDKLVDQLHLVSIPGRGFGVHGEGFVRLSAFTTPDQTEIALSRLAQVLSICS